MKAAAVVVAAGRGTRFGASRPKQFLPLRGKPLLHWSLRAFQRTKDVTAVVLVVSADRLDWAAAYCRRERLNKVVAVVPGGAERSDSVRNGVMACPAEADVLLIHDAARALVPPDVISKVARAAVKRGAALAAWPVPDTLKLAAEGSFPRVKKTVPRAGLWLAQTPQAFRRDVARKLFSKPAPRGMTDDVQLAERAGIPVELVPASSANFKVTLPDDFKMAKALLNGLL